MLVQMLTYFILACIAYRFARIRFDKENAEEIAARHSTVNESEE
jgi:hypothetical protein